jgi:hypothetical protein
MRHDDTSNSRTAQGSTNLPVPFPRLVCTFVLNNSWEANDSVQGLEWYKARPGRYRSYIQHFRALGSGEEGTAMLVSSQLDSELSI